MWDLIWRFELYDLHTIFLIFNFPGFSFPKKVITLHQVFHIAQIHSVKEVSMFQVKGRYFNDDPSEPYYAVVIAELGIYTQGETPEECLEMAKDAVELMVESPGFIAEIVPLENQEFLVRSNSCQLLRARADHWAEFSRRFQEEAHATLSFQDEDEEDG
jgi:predicted RNase H-like HicB family nuclease